MWVCRFVEVLRARRSAWSGVCPSARTYMFCLEMAVASLCLSIWCTPSQAVSGSGHHYAAGLGFSLMRSTTEPYAACPPAGAGRMACQVIVFPFAALRSPGGVAATPSSAGANTSASAATEANPAAIVCNGGVRCGDGPYGGYSPADLRAAYRLPSTTGGAGQTVAIVDAYDDPNAESDMNVYREYYGIPVCTEGSGCFTKVNQQGGSSYPKANSEWVPEISVDLDMVSAACPNCRVLLVEANSASSKDLGTAENEAATLGATEISNSFSSEEAEEGRAGEAAQNKYYEHPGIPITAAAGDYGYDNEAECITLAKGEKICGHSPSFPAVSPAVISVGETVLKPEENSRGWLEEASESSGSGCSLYEKKPKWQTDVKCTNRTDNDVAAVGDPNNSRVSVYDSFENKPAWSVAGGTSVGAPLVAGAIALEPSSLRALAAKGIYENPSNWYDITAGHNWRSVNCESYLCNAGVGYDGPTGMGTPDGGAPVVVPPGKAAIVSETGGSLALYFRAANGAILEDHWNVSTKTWTLNELSGAAPGKPGDPAVVVESGGNRDVYFRGTSGVVWQDRWVASEGKWTLTEVGGSAAGDPAAVIEGSGNRDVYFRGTNGAIWQERWIASEGKWTLTEVGGAAAGDPTAVLESSGNRDVYFRGTNGAIWQERWIASESKWKLTELGGVAYGEPAAVLLPSGNQDVFFKDAAEAFVGEWEWKAAAGAWTLHELSGADAKNLSVTLNASGEPLLFYQGYLDPRGEVMEEKQTKEGWASSHIAGAGAGEPTATLQSNGNPEVFVPDIGGGISQVSYDEGSWSLAQACNGPCQLPVWSIAGTPNPTETLNSDFWGVSCSSAAACTAVGEYEKEKAPNVHLTLAESWNGSEWQLQSTPNPGAAKDSTLYRSSCTSALECTAVGYYLNSSGTYFSLAERFSDNEWQLQSTPEPSGTLDTLLADVSCAAPTACTAVGTYENSSSVEAPLAEGWNGVKWSLQSLASPSEAKAVALEAVSCTSSSACIAAGEDKDSAGVFVPFAEGWNGVKWSLQSMSAPAGATRTWLNDVSCSSASACTAVGYYSNGSTYVPFAERLSGTAWSSPTTLPVPAGSSANYIDGVSCSSASACMAAGVSVNSAGKDVTLAERWNGSEWLVQSTPNVENAKGWLSGGVSCVSPLWCAAVGNAGKTLAELYR
jgi:hypothetical protein